MVCMKRNETMENMGRKERRWRVGFRLAREECGAVLPMRRMGTAARPMSTTRY